MFDQQLRAASLEQPAGRPPWTPEGISPDASVAHPARRHNYWLGGTDNFPADRASGDAVAALFPTVRTAVLENRRFLGRAVRHLAVEAGIDQYLDIGTGIPSAGHTHEVAQALDPWARVVYVDDDPVVVAHARAVLTSRSPHGAVAYLRGDLREPGPVLDDPALRATLDLSRPVALVLVGVVQLLADDERPHDLVRQLVQALAPGSYLVLSHATHDLRPARMPAAEARRAALRQAGVTTRSLGEVARFFEGLELMRPGVVSAAEWWDDEPRPRPPLADVATWAGVARKPLRRARNVRSIGGFPR